MLLPQKLGPITLMRKLGTDGVSEAFVGILDEPAGQHVVVRRLLPFVVQDAARLATVESRVQDLTAVRHPTLVPVLRTENVGNDHLIIEDHVDAVSLGDVIAWCRKSGEPLPHNVFLNLATQICNGLEALHGRPGKASGEEHVLHLALSPESVLITPEGRLMVGEFGLIRSPTALPSGGSADASARRLAHVSPEQTHPDQKLTPASDIFSLGSLLYELLMLEPLFRRESSLQTIHAVRKAEVSGALQMVKKALPGLDKVLYRALSLNPRHRYQRAFVLREDIRGLMAGFSFTRINEETTDFLAPLFAARAQSRPAAASSEDSQDNTGALLREAAGLPEPAPNDTRGFLRGVAQDTLVPSFTDSGATVEDDLEGLEMWSEVPTTVDPSDPAAIPVATTTDLPHDLTVGAPDVPRDQTTWIPRVPRSTTEWIPVTRDEGPKTGDFDEDIKTDITADPAVERSLTPQEKRQLTPAELQKELAALGVEVRPTPPPAAAREEGPDESPSIAPTMSPEAATETVKKDLGTPSSADTMAMFMEDDEEPPSEEDVPAPGLAVAGGAAAVGAAAARGRGGDGPTVEPAPAPHVSADGDTPASQPQRAQPNPSSSYRPKGAAPPPAPDAGKGPQIQSRKLEGLTFDEDEDTAVHDEDDLDWKPRRSGRGLVIVGAALAVFVVVLLCGGVAVLAGQGVVTSWFEPGPVAGGPGTTEPDTTPATPTGTTEPAATTPETPSTVAAGTTEPAKTEPDVAETGGNAGGSQVVASKDPTPEPRPLATEPRTTPTSRTPTNRTSTDRTPSSNRGTSTASLTPTASTAPAASTAPTTRTPSTNRVTSRDPDPPRLSTSRDSGSLIDATPTTSSAGTETVIKTETEPVGFDALASKSRTGSLSAGDRLTLEMVERTDPSYTRSRAILYEDAKARADGSAQRKYLDALLTQPENKYNPTFLAEGAHMDIADKRFDRALSRAETAERHWARLPSSLVFSRKAMIYEAQAAAWQGKFYQSGGSDMAALGQAISAWEKYQRHVATKSRTDLAQLADAQLTKLYDARRRLE